MAGGYIKMKKLDAENKCAILLIIWLVSFGITCIINITAVWVGFMLFSIILILIANAIDAKEEYEQKLYLKRQHIKLLSENYLKEVWKK